MIDIVEKMIYEEFIKYKTNTRAIKIIILLNLVLDLRIKLVGASTAKNRLLWLTIIKKKKKYNIELREINNRIYYLFNNTTIYLTLEDLMKVFNINYINNWHWRQRVERKLFEII